MLLYNSIKVEQSNAQSLLNVNIVTRDQTKFLIKNKDKIDVTSFNKDFVVVETVEEIDQLSFIVPVSDFRMNTVSYDLIDPIDGHEFSSWTHNMCIEAIHNLGFNTSNPDVVSSKVLKSFMGNEAVDSDNEARQKIKTNFIIKPGLYMITKASWDKTIDVKVSLGLIDDSNSAHLKSIVQDDFKLPIMIVPTEAGYVTGKKDKEGYGFIYKNSELTPIGNSFNGSTIQSRFSQSDIARLRQQVNDGHTSLNDINDCTSAQSNSQVRDGNRGDGYMNMAVLVPQEFASYLSRYDMNGVDISLDNGDITKLCVLDNERDHTSYNVVSIPFKWYNDHLSATDLSRFQIYVDINSAQMSRDNFRGINLPAFMTVTSVLPRRQHFDDVAMDVACKRLKSLFDGYEVIVKSSNRFGTEVTNHIDYNPINDMRALLKGKGVIATYDDISASLIALESIGLTVEKADIDGYPYTGLTLPQLIYNMPEFHQIRRGYTFDNLLVDNYDVGVEITQDEITLTIKDKKNSVYLTCVNNNIDHLPISSIKTNGVFISIVMIISSLNTLLGNLIDIGESKDMVDRINIGSVFYPSALDFENGSLRFITTGLARNFILSSYVDPYRIK